MRVSSWALLFLALVTACADARTQEDAEAPRAEAVSVTRSAPSAPPAVAAPRDPQPVEVPVEKGSLPIVCEAYFAKFSMCIEATLRRHPDESTRETVRLQFEKAQQRSRAMMTEGMEPKEAEEFCKQAITALTASPCE